MAVSENKRKNNDNYNKKCDYISIRPLKERGEQIRQAAKLAGQSLQGYILQACAERMDATACPSTSPPPMKKNKTDQHKSPCKLTACRGFSFSHYSHHPTSQQAAHHQQHRAAAHQPAPHHRNTSTSPNTDSQHTAHTKTHNTRRNTSGRHCRPADRRADDHQRNARPRRLRRY